MDEEWETPKEFGKVVGVSDKSIYRLIKNDPTFPAVVIGGTIRIAKGRSRQWLARQTYRKVRAKRRP